ncbi:hypothetical protein [Agromyces sp. NPDC058104]|uniref:hypothetical protein n=1 Tax=Agromyces sp. NPDC058104 TaxID=3346342 RepID=UPI0036DF8BA0
MSVALAARPAIVAPGRTGTVYVTGRESITHTSVDTTGSVDPQLRNGFEQFAAALDTVPILLDLVLVSRSTRGGYLRGSTWPVGLSFAVDSLLPAETADDPSTSGASDVVELVRSLEGELGLPLRDVLMAAGIKKRTFHSWVGSKSRTPHLQSQGRLWLLADAVEDLRETLDQPIKNWLHARPERLALLRAGDFDALVDVSIEPARGEQYRPAFRAGVAEEVDMPVIRTKTSKPLGGGDRRRP